MDKPSCCRTELAELVGILLGDGCIGRYRCKDGDGGVKVQDQVKVTLSSEERDYAKHVESLFLDVFEIQPSIWEKKNEKVIEIRSFRSDLFEFLVQDLGLKESPKWNSAVIPEIYLERDLEKYILKGYFDTDGSVVLVDNNGVLYPRLEMKVCPSPMQKQLLGVLRRHGFDPGVYDIGDGKVRVQMNGKQPLERWKDRIGFSNNKHQKKIAGAGFEPATSGFLNSE